MYNTNRFLIDTAAAAAVTIVSGMLLGWGAGFAIGAVVWLVRFAVAMKKA